MSGENPNRAAALRDRVRANFLGRPLLWAASWVYGAVALLRRFLYAHGVLPSKHAGPRTICIGNLTAGGTGKTTAVLLAAQTLRKKDLSVAILSRGYKRPEPGKEVLVLLKAEHPSWRQAGDEPWMLHHALRGLDVPILVSPDRLKAAETAVAYYKPDVLLMDDGFQHLRLQRDTNIVLLNATDPWGGGGLLPLGDLREPRRALRQASLVLLTHADRVSPEELDRLRAEIHGIHPGAAVAEAAHRPCFILDLGADVRKPLTHLKNREVTLFCGIGDPASFRDQLRRLGAKVAQEWRFPDHHPYTLEELRSIERTRGDRPVVTTFKDFPRLPEHWQEELRGEVLALGIRMEITRGKQFWEAQLCGK
ncbi:MAG: tetraacyldisaccharide 4'-kinase [Elusimicrobia bacterium]|nr:tetraacyldisaccharide 4'-kinase [Elusimicrobiota bacterium]